MRAIAFLPLLAVLFLLGCNTQPPTPVPPPMTSRSGPPPQIQPDPVVPAIVEQPSTTPSSTLPTADPSPPGDDKPPFDPKEFDAIVQDLKPLGIEVEELGTIFSKIAFNDKVLDDDGKIPEAAVALLAKLPHEPKRSLLLNIQPVTDATLTQIKDLQLATMFYFTVMKVSDEGLRTLSEVPHVSMLTMSLGEGVTDDGVAALGKAAELEELSLDMKKTATEGAFLAGLNEHPRLKSLTLFGGQWSDEVVGKLSALPELQAFSLYGGHLTGSGLTFLKSAKKLKDVYISQTSETTDVALLQLEGLPELKLVKLENRGAPLAVTGRSLQSAATLPKLQELWFVGAAGLTDDDLAALTASKSLQNLYLEGSESLTDACLPTIAKIATLERLFLTGANITDEGLEKLQPATKLLQLGVRGTAVTPAGATRLKELIPNLGAIEH